MKCVNTIITDIRQKKIVWSWKRAEIEIETGLIVSGLVLARGGDRGTSIDIFIDWQWQQSSINVSRSAPMLCSSRDRASDKPPPQARSTRSAQNTIRWSKLNRMPFACFQLYAFLFSCACCSLSLIGWSKYRRIVACGANFQLQKNRHALLSCGICNDVFTHKNWTVVTFYIIPTRNHIKVNPFSKYDYCFANYDWFQFTMQISFIHLIFYSLIDCLMDPFRHHLSWGNLPLNFYYLVTPLFHTSTVISDVLFSSVFGIPLQFTLNEIN